MYPIMVSDRSNHHLLEHTDNLIYLPVGLVTVSNVLLDIEEDAVLGTNPISWDNWLNTCSGHVHNKLDCLTSPFWSAWNHDLVTNHASGALLISSMKDKRW